MPFQALLEDKLVAPAMVENRQKVNCPECNDIMFPRGGEEIARHFYHVNEEATNSCPIAGESDLHRRCKALALEALKEQWGQQANSYGVEVPVDVSYTPTDPDRRKADSLIEFDSRNEFFGTGIIIEIQHKHEDKNLRRVTYDYISADYSVAWLSPQHFEKEYLDYAKVDEMFEEYGPRIHNWQGGEPMKVGHAISPRIRHPDTLGPLPDDLETYRGYPNPHTDISERRWDIMVNPWR